MVEQAVQTVPLAGAAQKRGKTPTQPQGKQPARPTQRSGRAGSLVQKENVPASKLTVAPKEEKSHIFLFLQHFYFLQLTLIMKIINLCFRPGTISAEFSQDSRPRHWEPETKAKTRSHKSTLKAIYWQLSNVCILHCLGCQTSEEGRSSAKESITHTCLRKGLQE